MDNKLTTQQTQLVTLTNGTQIEKSSLGALPSILEKSIVSSYPLVKDSTEYQKNLFIDSLIKLLQIKVSDKEKKEKSRLFFEYVFLECLSALKGLKLSEIYEAYKMALNGELLLNNERIEIYPELSNITFGKIIQALKAYKQENTEYLNAKSKLLALQGPDQLEAERKIYLELQLDFWKRAFEFCVEVGYQENMHRIYFKIEKENKLIIDPEVKKNKYSEVLKDYENELNIRKSVLTENKDNLQVRTITKNIEELKTKAQNNNNEAVINRCKSFFVSQWIINNKLDFRSFYKLVYLSEIKNINELITRIQEIYKSITYNDKGEIFKNNMKIGQIEMNNNKYTFIEL